MTPLEYIERSNSNGKWVTETMFLNTVDRIERRFDRMETLLTQLMQSSVADDAEDEAATRFNEQVQRRVETHEDRWWQVKLALISATFGGSIGAVMALLVH